MYQLYQIICCNYSNLIDQEKYPDSETINSWQREFALLLNDDELPLDSHLITDAVSFWHRYELTRLCF
jgi:hypothetical protein